MYRREFIVHSGVVLGAVVVGLPSLSEALTRETAESSHSGSPRLIGHKRSGCARPPHDPLIALQFPPEFPAYFA
jgi:hypothetical protein